MRPALLRYSSLRRGTHDSSPRAPSRILAAVAEIERSRISERVRSVKQHLTRTGHFTGGKVPAGYQNRKGKLVLDPRWAQAVKTMKSMRSKGLTFRATADGMTKQGRPMTAATVYRIVSGKREVDGLTTTA